MTKNSEIALIIIFNHRYDQNIETLDRLYRGRFNHIYFLVPFYNGMRRDVIPVYGNSYRFSLYIAQAYKAFFKEEYSHYFFIADDLILNPALNERNLLQYLGVKNNDCFIPKITSIHKLRNRTNLTYALNFSMQHWGLEAASELPAYEEAVGVFAKHNLEIKPVHKKQLFEPETLKQKAKRFVKTVLGKQKRRMNTYRLPYPQVAGASDIFLVSKQAITKFSHYCGVFGAMELFVEVAIPTSLVLSSEEIKFESGLELKGEYLWPEQDLKILSRFNNNLSHLLNDFPPNHLFLHPVKLSKWKL